MNYYLKTTDEQSMWQALENANLAKKEYDMDDPLNVQPDDYDSETNGEFVKTGAYEWIPLCQLDMIGTIYKETGNMLTDENGNEYPETAAIEGFHANLKSDEVIEGLPTITAPATPYRIWFGD